MSGLVITFANRSYDMQYVKVVLPFFSWPIRKWNPDSMCLCLPWAVRFFSRLIVDLLSTKCTTICFPDHHEIIKLNNLNTYLIILIFSLCLHTNQIHKNHPSYPSSHDIFEIRCHDLFFTLRHLMILLIVCICDNLDSCINILTTPTLRNILGMEFKVYLKHPTIFLFNQEHIWILKFKILLHIIG